MPTPELGACDWFVWDLRRSELADGDELEQLACEFLKDQPHAEPPALARFLVEHSILTEYQANRLLQGKGQGLVLGPYMLIDALGTGSMGTVFKATSKNDTSTYFALKVLPRRSMWNVRIARRQVKAFENWQHPAVVPFVDVGTAGSNHYLVWPFVEGTTLERLVEREGKLSPGVAALYALQTAQGLEVCHQKELVHGMIKPSNLMVDEETQLRILDFGIGTLLANVEGGSLVDTMSTANTLTSGLDCASPESIMDPANCTPAGDQYGLGCTLYYCLTGRYPFPDGTAVDKMTAHQTKEPTPIRELAPDVPRELEAVVARLMRKKPEQRYGSIEDVAHALKPLAAPVPAAKPADSRSRTSDSRHDGSARPVRLAALSLSTGLPGSAGASNERHKSAGDDLAELRTTPLPPGLRVGPRPSPLPFRPQSQPERQLSLEERLGPRGVVIGALVAAGLTWLATLWLFK